MAMLPNQAEPNRIVEPVTPEVQRPLHTVQTSNPQTYPSTVAHKYGSQLHTTANIGTPQGEKILADIRPDSGVKLGNSEAEEEEKMDGLAAEEEEEEEEPQEVLNGKLQMSPTVPGLVEKKKPLTAEDIPNTESIGGKPNEVKEIEGVPFTPQIAAAVRSSEDKAGHDTGKGSPSARVQSAASFNVRE